MTQFSRLSLRRSNGLTMALALVAALLLAFPAFSAAPPASTSTVPEESTPSAGLDLDSSKVLTLAHTTSAGAFKKSARSDLTYAHLISNPDEYRGSVLHVSGKLKLIKRLPVPREAVDEGVNHLYEAWIFSESLGANPYCVRFTEWPADLPRSLLGAKIPGDYTVALDGYFFKKFRYRTKANNSEREAPLLIGHSLVVLRHAPGNTRTDERRLDWLTTSLLAMFGSLFMPAFGLTWWFRRSDNRFRRGLGFYSPPFSLPPDALPVAYRGSRSRWLFSFGRLGQPPRIAASAGSGKRSNSASSANEGGKRRSPDTPPEEGAGA